jgi:hypothetical protein
MKLENTKNTKIITNPIGKDGNVLCPACMSGAVYQNDGKMYTSPMRRFTIPGKVNALMHECCISKMLAEARIRK